MGVNLEEVPIQVMVVRIDGKRLTQSMLEQIPIYSFWQFIRDRNDPQFEWHDAEYDFICRISAVPVLKSLKAHLTRTKDPYSDPDYIARRLEDYRSIKEFGLWGAQGTLYLYPCGDCPKRTGAPLFGPFKDVDEGWYEDLDYFDECFEDAPLALIGV